MKRLIGLSAAVVLVVACSNNDSTGTGTKTSTACGSGSGTTLALAVGGVQVLSTPADFACISVPAQSAASEYIFAATNVNTKGDVNWNYAVSVTGGPSTTTTASVESPAAASAPALSLSRQMLSSPAALYGTSLRGRFEQRRRALESRLSIPAAKAFLSRTRSSRATSGISYSVQRALPNVGDVLTFNVPDTINQCTQFNTVGAKVLAVTQHAIFVQDTTAPANGFTSADITSYGQEFDNIIYATDTVHFGSPGDLDQNGHVYILITPRVNAMTPKGKSQNGFVAGFFFGGDLFPRTGTTAGDHCQESNLGEIFYILAPDPSGTFSDAHTVEDVRQNTRGLLAHEFQHMINLAVRIQENADFEEVPWLNEGLSHFAEEIVGRAVLGLTDLHQIITADLVDAATQNANFAAFFANDAFNFDSWLERPDTAGATSNDGAEDCCAVRGSSWSLVRYSADQFSNGNVPQFSRALVAGPDTGALNLTKRSGTTFDQVITGWVGANYATGLGVTNLPSKYTYVSWNMRDVEAAVNAAINGNTPGSRVYPLAVTNLTSGFTQASGSVQAAAAAYYRLSSTGALPSTVVKFTAPGGGTNTDATGRVVVMRTK